MAQARPAPQQRPAPARPAQRPAAAAPAQEEGTAPAMPMTVTGSIKSGDHAGKSASVQYDFGSTLDEMVEKFGENVVYGVALDQLVIRLQALIRRLLESEDFSQDKLEKAADDWKPTVGGGVRKSAAEKVSDLLGKMSPEQRQALLASLTGGAAPKAAPARPAARR